MIGADMIRSGEKFKRTVVFISLQFHYIIVYLSAVKSQILFKLQNTKKILDCNRIFKMHILKFSSTKHDQKYL